MRYVKPVVILAVFLGVAAGGRLPAVQKSDNTESAAQSSGKYVIWPEQTDASLRKEYADTFPILVFGLTLARVFESPVTGKMRLEGTYYLVGSPIWKTSDARVSLCWKEPIGIKLGDIDKTCLVSTPFTLSFKQPLPRSAGEESAKEVTQYYGMPFFFTSNLQKGKKYILVLQTLRASPYEEVELTFPMGNGSTMRFDEESLTITSDTIIRYSGIKGILDVPYPSIPVALSLIEEK